METVALLYEDYQKELAEDFKNTFLKRASDTDSSRSNDTVIDEVTDMLSTNIAVYTEKLLQRWGFSSGGEGGGGGDVTVTLDDLLKKYLSDNYVTIKGDQEVFGEKDFRKGIRIAGRRLYWDEGNDALVIEGAAYTTRWLSAKGVSPGGGGAGSGGAAAMYQLIDVSPNDTKDAVLGAEKDYVLTFDGSFWRGMPNKGGLSSKLFTALDKEGHEINPDDENAEIYAIRANYSLWSVGFLSAKGISDGGTGGGGGGGAVALYQLLDVEKNADITGVAGATKGSVLTFNGDKWYADKPKTAAGISNLFTALDKDGNEVDLNDESKLSTITNIRANYALWSVDWISAKGKSSGGSGGGGGLINLVYGFESLGGTFDNNDNSATFNAFTINEIWKLASSGLTNVTVTGSGNAVTDVIKGSDGRSLTFTKGSTFATKSEFDALNTKFNDFLTGSDADDIINKWSELEVFLQGMKESDNLAVILQSKMDKTAFSKLFTALDASGNEVDPSDDTKTIASIRANFGFWGVDYISAKGVSMSGAQTGTLDSLNDVEITDPVNGQALKYDAASKKWVNGTIDSFNVNQMWAELKKADSSKVIDASHIPTSVLDGRWVKKAGDTMTGTLTSASSSGSIVFKGVENCDITNIYKDNGVIRNDDGGLTSIRNGLRFNWYDTYWYIGNLRGDSTESAGFGVVDHNNKLVLRVTPNDVRAPRFMSTVATGVSPLIVSSNTVVGNLNADLLDGLHEYSFLRHRDTYGIDGYNTLWAQIGIRQYNDAKPDGMANPIYDYGAVISLPGGNTRLDIWYNHMSSASDSPTNGIQYRSGFNDDKKPWRMLLDSVNYASYSDGRYVKKSGDTMTGDLTMNNTKGFNIGWSTRVVKTSGVWIHGGSDAASVDDANLRFGSWNGIGWYPTISGQTVAQGKNAMWLNVRNGNLDTHGAITAHTNYLAANWDSARRLVLGGGSSYAWIDSRNSSNNILCNIVLQDNKVVIGNHAESSRFVSTVGTGTQPYQCSSTTLNTNLNADMLDNWHLNFFPRNYNIGRCYAVRFALGGEDNGWKKIFACSESGTGPYRSVTVWGRIWYAHGNHAQSEVWNYHFCAIFYMRSDPSSSDSSVGNVKNSARLYLPTFAKGMDNIRLVRVGTNNFELQVRQIGSYHNANIEYQYWSFGCNVSAWESLQPTSNTSVVVSAGGASTLADSRASSADVWTSARTFYIQDHNASHTGAGVSVNGSANVYLKLPNSIQCSDWFRSTGNSGWYHQDYGGGWYMQDSTYIRNYGSKRLRIQTDTYDTLQLVRTSGSGGSSIAFYNGGGTFRGQLGVNASSWFSFDTGTATANQNVVEISPAGGIHSKAEITAKASGSDIRLKKDIQNYNAMSIINKFRSVKYHWNDIAKANSEVYNNDYDQFGLIAQDLIAGGFGQWVRDVFHDYYTVTYERLIPVVWKGLQEVDDEVTKLKKEITRLNKKVEELEKSLCA